MFPLQNVVVSECKDLSAESRDCKRFRSFSAIVSCFIALVSTVVGMAEQPAKKDERNQPASIEEAPEKSQDSAQPQTGEEIARQLDAQSLSQPAKEGLKVLILGDSMALSGFADTLDQCFRSCPGVSSVHTVICCGTNPLSWLKASPYTHAKTRCGFLEIQNHDGAVSEIRDIYGMKKGHKPAVHAVPKIEDLVGEWKPDIIVFQSGNNFFDLFKNGEVIDKKSATVIRAHVSPLVTWIISSAPTVKKWYWVTPPQAGNVTTEVQGFVFDSIKQSVDGYAVMLDSREITSYPYPLQDRDRMHFWGQACNDWGRNTFRMIAKDLAEVEMTKLPSLVSIAAERSSTAAPVAIPVADAPTAKQNIRVRAKLVATSSAPAKKDLTTYGEYLVVYLYDVIEVKSGKYEEKRLLLLHPAFIKKEEQNLSRYKVGKQYELVIQELDDISLWATTRRSPENDDPDLIPHMLVDDMNRHPDAKNSVEVPSENSTAP
ncbi:MAG: hypothetical protein RI957_1161 [Verrucomicrobiota bacterium]|jgi:hypothetical protein